MSGRRWTTTELAYLHSEIARTPTAQIADALGRTVQATERKASYLGWRRRQAPPPPRAAKILRLLTESAPIAWSLDDIRSLTGTTHRCEARRVKDILSGLRAAGVVEAIVSGEGYLFRAVPKCDLRQRLAECTCREGA